MSSITTFMANEHRHCDDLFSATETAVSNNDWSSASNLWQKFHDEVEQHFSREEDVLFPAFEAATGATGGPTTVMRMEHQQMRQLFQQIEQALTDQDQDQMLGLTETLMILIAQHNMKEEQILYPMAQQTLPDSDEVLQAMQAC